MITEVKERSRTKIVDTMATILVKELVEFDCCTVVGEKDGTYSVGDLGLEIVEDGDGKYVVIDKSPKNIEL